MISADIIEAEETAHGLAVHNGPCVALGPGFIKIPQPWDCLRDAAGPTALCLSAKRENGQRVSITTRPRLLLPPDDPDGLHISLSPRWIC